MIGAYIQIIVMLLGAFLLGMFVTWQYWRKKFGELQDSYQELEEESSKAIQELKERVETLTNEVQERDDQLSKSEKQIQRLEKKEKKLENEVQEKSKQIEELEERIEIQRKEIEVLDGELVATHDELFGITKKPKKSSYYKYIDGKRYKAITLKEAEAAASGKGDGRISMEDARKIFNTISDGKRYTPVEKATIRYLRENYKWTDQADKLFRHLVGSWAAHDHKVDEIRE